MTASASHHDHKSVFASGMSTSSSLLNVTAFAFCDLPSSVPTSLVIYSPSLS